MLTVLDLDMAVSRAEVLSCSSRRRRMGRGGVRVGMCGVHRRDRRRRRGTIEKESVDDRLGEELHMRA